jgi:hypothetical protein
MTLTTEEIQRELVIEMPVVEMIDSADAAGYSTEDILRGIVNTLVTYACDMEGRQAPRILRRLVEEALQETHHSERPNDHAGV